MNKLNVCSEERQKKKKKDNDAKLMSISIMSEFPPAS